MENFDKEFIRQLWDENEENTWTGLREAADFRINRPEGETNEIARIIRDFAIKKEGEYFPSSFDEFYKMLEKVL